MPELPRELKCEAVRKGTLRASSGSLADGASDRRGFNRANEALGICCRDQLNIMRVSVHGLCPYQTTSG
jgi:hypothetical protein